MRIVFTFILSLICSFNLLSQVSFQHDIEARVDSIIMGNIDLMIETKNILKEDVIFLKTYSDVLAEIDFDKSFTFEGFIWELNNFMGGYAFRIGSKNPDVSTPVFYNFMFDVLNKHIDYLSEIDVSKRQKVSFTFKFIDTISGDKEPDFGLPYHSFGGSDAPFYNYYIDLESIKIIE